MRQAAITPLGGISNDQLLWQDMGRTEGFQQGLIVGKEQGLTEGYNEGFNQGYVQGYNAGAIEGNTVGYNEAIDEANAAIELIQAQHTAYQNDSVARHQACEKENEQLRQALVNQAIQIRALEQKLTQNLQVAQQQQAKIDSQLRSYQQLKQEHNFIKGEAARLSQQIQTLRQENAALNDTNLNLIQTKNTNHVRTIMHLENYNKALTFLNAMRSTIEFLAEQNPVIDDMFRALFASEYKKAVDFRLLVDDIKAAPHEDSDFPSLLPQAQSFILRMLEKSPQEIS